MAFGAEAHDQLRPTTRNADLTLGDGRRPEIVIDNTGRRSRALHAALLTILDSFRERMGADLVEPNGAGPIRGED